MIESSEVSGRNGGSAVINNVPVMEEATEAVTNEESAAINNVESVILEETEAVTNPVIKEKQTSRKSRKVISPELRNLVFQSKDREKASVAANRYGISEQSVCCKYTEAKYFSQEEYNLSFHYSGVQNLETRNGC